MNHLLRLALAAVVAAPAAATAQNLGRLGLLSSLGEPLDAQIEIVAPPEARASLAASIVPIGVYERFGVTPSPPPDVLRATVEQAADGRPVVRLRSTVPLQRPTVEVIVELAWSGGRMVRQYSFAVDPPAGAVARAEQAPAPKPAPASAPTPASAEAAPPAAKPAAAPPAAKPVAKPAPKPAPKPQTAEKAVRPKAPATAAKAPRKDAGPTDREIAAAEERVRNLERTMSELQQQIDARNREIEALQRQSGGAAK